MHTSEELPATGATGPTPVFLDATGRRLKRARLVGGTVTAAVAAYVVLLVSAALGGPSIDAPFLPRPAAPTRGLAALPSATPMTDTPMTAQGNGRAVGATTAGSFAAAGQAAVLRGGAGSTVAPVAATTAPGTPVSSAASSATAPSVPVATTGTPTPPAPTPTATATHPGRSAGAPGRTARPTVSRTH